MEDYNKKWYKCQGDLIDVDYDKYDGITICEDWAQIYMQYQGNKKIDELKIEYNFPNISDIREHLCSRPEMKPVQNFASMVRFPRKSKFCVLPIV